MRPESSCEIPAKAWCDEHIMIELFNEQWGNVLLYPKTPGSTKKIIYADVHNLAFIATERYSTDQCHFWNDKHDTISLCLLK